MQRWAKTLAAWAISLVVLPVLLLGLVEGSIRAAYPKKELRVFVPRTVDGIHFMQLNNDFYRRFLSFSLPPERDIRVLLDAIEPKPEGGVRLVVLGGSAAKGWPDSTMAYWRFLEAIARAAYPEVPLEFYCLASPALDSTVMRYIGTAACASIEPDVVLLYLGNNELNGPFTSSLLAGFDTGEERMQAVDRIHSLRGLRLFELMVSNRGPSPEDEAARQRAGFGERTREGRLIFDTYRYNLEQIIQASEDAGAEVCLSTLVANLRDWPPESDAPEQPLVGDDAAQWESGLANLRAQLSSGEYEAALREVSALRDLSEGAVLSYLEGQALMALNRDSEARTAFEQAMDLDLPMFVRARTAANRVIRAVAEEYDASTVTLVDGEGAMSAQSPHGIPGREFLLDHCHLSVEGAHALAVAFWPAVDAAIARRLGRPPTGFIAPGIEECAERLGVRLVDDGVNRKRLLDVHEGRVALAGLRSYYDEHYGAIDASEQVDPLPRLARAFALSGVDYLNGQKYVDALLLPGSDFALAERIAREHAARYPQSAIFRSLMGRALEANGNPDAAEHEIQVSLEIDPEEYGIRAAYAESLLNRNRCDEAKVWYEELVATSPDDYRALEGLARTALCLRVPDALAPIEHIIELNPDGPAGYELLLAYYQTVADDTDGLRRHLEELAGRYPEAALPRQNLEALNAQ
ncbi:MAG: hypothetical protein GC168_12445 [Candidatus Hydrogenedens sp.]|nr:hypothetical protein [Candidatus Hydrogenedens sp.]